MVYSIKYSCVWFLYDYFLLTLLHNQIKNAMTEKWGFIR